MTDAEPTTEPTDDPTSDPIAGLLDEELGALSALGHELADADWDVPTALPGWTVKDCFSHVVETERTLAGDPAEEADVSHLAHVERPFQQFTEPGVEARRGLPGAEVLAQLDEVWPRRIAALRAMTPAELDVPGWSPIGEVPYRDFMAVRVFDMWMHEQDVRRALGRPGHETGPAADRALDRFRAAVPFVVGKKAGAPDGSSVVFRCTGGNELVLAIAVEGRARVVDEADLPGEPTTTITLPFGAFVALGGGRWTADEARAAGGVDVAGDVDLGDRILAGMAFTP